MLEAAGLHARHVEVARRFGSLIPAVVELARIQTGAAEWRRVVEKGRSASEERNRARGVREAWRRSKRRRRRPLGRENRGGIGRRRSGKAGGRR